MKFKILSESDNRIRIQVLQKNMSLKLVLIALLLGLKRELWGIKLEMSLY